MGGTSPLSRQSKFAGGEPSKSISGLDWSIESSSNAGADKAANEITSGLARLISYGIEIFKYIRCAGEALAFRGLEYLNEIEFDPDPSFSK